MQFLRLVILYANKNNTNYSHIYLRFHEAEKGETLGIHSIMMRMAHEQFIFQEPILSLKQRLARQYLLVAYLKKSDIMPAGEIQLRIQVLFLIYSVSKEHPSHDLLTLPELLENDSKDKTFEILNELTKTSVELKELIIDRKEYLKERGVDNEFSHVKDISIFKEYPLIRHKEKVHIMHLALLSEYSSYFMYNYFRTHKGVHDFADIYELYLIDLIKRYVPHFKTEECLREIFKTKSIEGSVIDDCIIDSNGPIGLEFKSCEAVLPLQLEPTKDNLKKHFKNNLIKAVHQWLNFRKVNAEHQIITPDLDDSFFIIITYRDIYQSMNVAWDGFIKESLCEDYETNNRRYKYTLEDIEAFDPSKIFIMTIDEFEIFVANDKERRHKVLVYAQDKYNSEGRLSFNQILQEMNLMTIPNYLNEAFEELSAISKDMIKDQK